MDSFTDFHSILIEDFAADFPEKATTKKAQLFLGRMQPIHNGHAAILKMMKNPIVVLVKGKESSKDKSRNPLDAKYQAKLIQMIDKKAEVIVAPNGYIPDMIKTLREKGIEIDSVLAGNDRIGDYKKQIDGLNKKLPKEKQMKIKFIETPRVTSATKVREAIRADNQKEFEKLTPKVIHKEYAKLRKLIK